MSDDLVKRARDWNFCWPSYDVEMLVPEMADRIEELEAKLAEEIRISNLRGNMIEFQLLPDLHDAQAKLAKAVDGLREIDDKVSWEINPSNYSHDQVCTMNDDWCEVGSIARTTIAELTGGKDE